MGLDKEAIGFLIVGGLILAAILFVAGIFRERNTCALCGNKSSPLILRDHDQPDHDLPNTGEWNELVKCKRCGYKWRRAPMLMGGGDGGGPGGGD
ncbi:MAG: hypothetical protein VW683_15205 [Betaproteobacteria bacterium]|jgi:hypothetical protein